MKYFSTTPVKVTSLADATRTWPLVTASIVDTCKPCVSCTGIADTNSHARSYWVTSVEAFTNDLKHFSPTYGKILVSVAWTLTNIADIVKTS